MPELLPLDEHKTHSPAPAGIQGVLASFPVALGLDDVVRNRAESLSIGLPGRVRQSNQPVNSPPPNSLTRRMRGGRWCRRDRTRAGRRVAAKPLTRSAPLCAATAILRPAELDVACARAAATVTRAGRTCDGVRIHNKARPPTRFGSRDHCQHEWHGQNANQFFHNECPQN